jgi:GNAT superfamily N-acetyltransferase
MLLDFFRKEWGSGSDSDAGEVDLSVPQWVCVRGGEAIGYLGTIPSSFRVNGEQVHASWLKGFWVTERYRSGPIGPMLLEKALSELDLVGSQVVAPAARRVLESQGVTHRCTLFNRVLLLRAHRVAGRIDLGGIGLRAAPAPMLAGIRTLQKLGVMTVLGAIAGGGIRLVGATASLGSGGFSVREGWSLDARVVDDLWKRLRDQVSTSPDRSYRSLVQRYGAGDVHDLLSIWTGEKLEGWVVVRRPGRSVDPRLSGLRVASIADVYFPIDRPVVGVRAVRAAEHLARGHGADALLCSGSHPVLERVLARRGYVGLPRTVAVLARDGVRHAFANGGEHMWVTRGDARSDESL